MEAIRIEGLTKKYKDVVAVNDLHLTIRMGELFCLLGVNGAGKTTTVKMLCGLARPTAGDAILHGHSITKETAQVKRILAVSPQETAIAPGLTVEENLQLICGIHGFDKEACKKTTQALTQRLKLEQVLNKKAGKLSGGWQRRLSIAMALVTNPKILFLDEPTLGLDVIARSELWDIILALKGKVTIILTTHYMEEAEALSDRVGIMKNGSLLICDTAQNIRTQTHTETLEKAFIQIVKGAEQ